MTLPSSSTPKTLPARYYTDPEVFRREMESFFSRMWVCVGREEQMSKAGGYFLREVDGESIIITRDQAGSVRAFYNVCRHRGTRMCRDQEGTFSNRIQCPYHGWTYALDGRLLGAPHMDESTFRCTLWTPLFGMDSSLSILGGSPSHSRRSSPTCRKSSRLGGWQNCVSIAASPMT
jgi:nitrite reductase/ring-hydroxylating ferredoxin subunit